MSSSFLPAPATSHRGGVAGEKETGARRSGGQCTGHAHQPYRDWPDPIHVAMATFLRPSVHQYPCSRSCPFNYPFHVPPPRHHRSPPPFATSPPPATLPPPHSSTLRALSPRSLARPPVPRIRECSRQRRLSRPPSLSLANREPSETENEESENDRCRRGREVGRKRGTGKREGMIPTFNRCRSCCRSVPSVAPAAVISRRAAFDRGSPLSFSCSTAELRSVRAFRLYVCRPRDVPSLVSQR